jgi:DNA-binding HxlR family transcriptional regulator
MDALKMLEIDRPPRGLRQCSIAAALDTIGERWSFLILRGAFNG